ncbi:MAG: hypothetical protein AAF710_11275 [Planctomycetota bacterium]
MRTRCDLKHRRPGAGRPWAAVFLLIAGGLSLGGCSAGVSAPWPEVMPADAGRATLRTRGDATPRAWSSFASLVVREPALVRADEPVAVEFYGRSVWLDTASGVVFGVSPDTLYALCFAGRARSGGVDVGPGQVLLWTAAGPEPRRYHVDAGYLRTTTTVVDDPDFDERLAAIEAR